MWKKLSLGHKLIFLFLFIGLLPALGIGLPAYQSAAGNIREEVYKTMDLHAALLEYEFTEFFAQQESNARILATTRDVYEGLALLEETDRDTTGFAWLGKSSTIDRSASSMKEEYGYELVFITTDDGTIVSSTNENILNTNLSRISSVEEALGGKTSWSPFFFSDIIQNNALVVSSPVSKGDQGGEIIGTVNFLLNQSAIDRTVHWGLEEFGESADAYLIDDRGLLLSNTLLGDYQEGAALQKTIETQAVEHYQNLLEKSKTQPGHLHMQDQYEDYRGIAVLGQIEMTQLGGTPAGLILEIDVKEAMAGIIRLKNLMLGIAAGSLALIFIVAFSFSGSIIKPVRKVAARLQEIAGKGGDLTLEVTVDSQDELGELGMSVNKMIANVREIVQRSIETAKTVSRSCDALYASVNSTSSALEQVAAGSNEFATGTQELNDRTREIAEISQRIYHHSEEGKDSIKATARQMDKIYEQVELLNNVISKLGKSAQEIGLANKLITDVSAQTGLLALNAAIEAARAGEQGRGFTVVSEEVRKLSEEATRTAGTIAELVKEIQETTGDAVDSTASAVRDVKAGSEAMLNSGRIFLSIFQSVERMSERMKEISATTEQLAAGSQEISASTQEQTSIMEEINATAEQLRLISNELTENLGRFRFA